MRRARAYGALALLVTSLVAACEVRELPVFEVPMVAGSGGAAGGDAVSGGGGASSGGSSAGTAQLAGGGGTAGNAAGLGGTSNVAGAGGSAGMAGAPQPVPCESLADCEEGWQCEKPRCDAVLGECVPNPPIFCPSGPAPVCGCNGVTYWNDCKRRQAGVQLHGAGECSVTARHCDIDEDCARHDQWAVCAHLVQGMESCHDSGQGACWVLPPVCSDVQLWKECRPPDAQPAPCVDTCEAIGSGRPHVRAKPGDQCKAP